MWTFLRQAAAGGATAPPARVVEVVHGARGRGRLVGLVEALEHGGEQPLGRAEDPRRLADVLGGDVAHLGRVLGGAVRHLPRELLEAHRVPVDVLPVDPLVPDQLVQQRVHQHQVRAGPRRQVSAWSTSAYEPGWPSDPNDALSAAAAVAVQSRVLPSTWLVPMPACAITPSV